MCRDLRLHTLLLAMLTTMTLALLPAELHAESAGQGLRNKNDISIRVLPIGLSMFSDVAYRLPLSKSDNILLNKTYLDAGFTANISPAYIWAGGYIEALPLSILQLRFSVMSMSYFGNLGILFFPENPQQTNSWTLDEIQNAQSNDLGRGGQGLLLEGRVTPRIKAGPFVAFSEFRLGHIRMDTEETYWEPYFDLLMRPNDTFLLMRPTVGYVWGNDDPNWYLMTGFRWSRTVTYVGNISRDLAGVLLFWGIPKTWWSTGRPQVAALAGYWVDHPNRAGTFWVGGQLTLSFGAN